MRDLQVNLSHSFETTFDTSGLFVAMRVFDDSGGSPVQVGAPIPMAVYYGSSYRGKFTPTEEKSYVVHKAVYTDGTYATLHPDYGQSSDAFRAVDFAGILLDAMIASYQDPGSVGEAIASSGGVMSVKLGTVAPKGVVVTPAVLKGNVIEPEVVKGHLIGD